MDLKTFNNRAEFIYNANSPIPKSPTVFSPKDFLDTRTRDMRRAVVIKPIIRTWAGKGAPFTHVHSRKGRDVNGFLRGDFGADQTVLYGAGAIAALIGWALWDAYNKKKTEAEAAQLEIESLKAQAQVDEGRKQELLGQVIVLQNQLTQLMEQKEALRSEIETKIDSLPKEDYVKIPGEVVEEVKGKKFPWTWLILGGLLIGGVVVWKSRKRLL